VDAAAWNKRNETSWSTTLDFASLNPWHQLDRRSGYEVCIDRNGVSEYVFANVDHGFLVTVSNILRSISVTSLSMMLSSNPLLLIIM
jgi:hypothetical protein